MSALSTLSPPAVTSVAYTIPASASPRDTLVTTALTLSSCDTGVTLTPAWSRICLAYLPAGTSSAARTTLRSGSARSARPSTPLGLPCSTTIASRLLAKLRGVTTRSLTLSMLGTSAEANTSAGAACWIWVARAWLPAKLKVTLAPPLALLYCSPSLVKAAVSDAAANTLISPGAAAPEPPSPEPSPPPQPARASAATASSAARRVRVRVLGMTPPLPRGRLAPWRRRQLDHHVGRLDGGHGQHPGGQGQLVGRLPGHQRHHPVGAGLELDLGHDLVLDDVGDDALEAVPGRPGDHLLVLGQVPMAAHELGQRRPVHDPLAALAPGRAQPARVGPAAHGVNADPQQLGHLADPVARHLLGTLPHWPASAGPISCFRRQLRLGQHRPGQADLVRPEPLQRMRHDLRRGPYGHVSAPRPWTEADGRAASRTTR